MLFGYSFVIGGQNLVYIVKFRIILWTVEYLSLKEKKSNYACDRLFEKRIVYSRRDDKGGIDLSLGVEW